VGNDPKMNFLGARLAVHHLHIEVPALVEDASIEQVERRIIAVATGILLDQPFVG
jgi:hypothetical protein